MTTNDTNTEYTSWLAYPEEGYVRTEDVEGLERRMAARHDDHAVAHMRDLIDRGMEVTCLNCGDIFHPAYRSRSPRCGRCRAAVQHATRKGTA